MTTPESQFELELEVLRTQVEECTQFFYAYLAMHAVAADHKLIREFANRVPLFWNTMLAALQTSTFIALGRVFDHESAHNVGRVLRIAQDHREIFSKVALGRRKQGNNPEPSARPDEDLREVYEPTPKDFRHIRAHILKWRRIYENNYRGLRHKVFAHKNVSSPTETAELFGKTNIRELEQMLVFLRSLYEALWQLFFNGRKPVLRPSRYSVKRMRDLPSPSTGRKTVQERITQEAEEFLMSATSAT